MIEPMRADTIAMLAAMAVAMSACGGPQRRPRTPGCVWQSGMVDMLDLFANRTVDVPPPCPDYGVAYIAGPLHFTAMSDGLRIQFEVSDPSFVPGTLRVERGQRDVVVVFPNGESPGRPTVELAAEATPRGYRVDDVVPWETWHLRGPNGSFRFLVVALDREATGAESETRVAFQLRIREAP